MLKLAKKYYSNRLCSKSSLKGRHFLTPDDVSPDEMKSLLMTSIDLKKCPEYLKTLEEKHIMVLLNEPCMRIQTSLHDTASMLNMPLNVLISSAWTTCQNPEDTGKLLSSAADIIFCQSARHSKVELFAKGATTVPVINISSCKFISLNILSDLLTIHEHFGKLDGLTIAWVGHPCALLNTYLSIAPSLGIQMNFLCRCGGPVSPANLNTLQKQGNVYRENIRECKSLLETISGAHVITTNQHSENNVKLRRTYLDEHADKNWVFLHTLPRSSVEVDEEIFNSKNNLLWKSFVNSKWICAAIISEFLDSFINLLQHFFGLLFISGKGRNLFLPELLSKFLYERLLMSV
ncbi:unnamed protein product [Phaedon cochleariae]|uniref:ornithine carbamoyltransferase n=1 Tax=Phaedon cochleariae TaxID=80249 RepID=A0A9P0DGZ4_PHACE|nr:unnamed protein product [Phaedon cochleariae]